LGEPVIKLGIYRKIEHAQRLQKIFQKFGLHGDSEEHKFTLLAK
jgi:hypothetical protein